MSQTSKIAMVALVVAAAVLVWWKWPQAPQPVQSQSKEHSSPSNSLAAAGRVEGREETIAVGSPAEGVIKELLVTNGQTVSKGTMLAVINCDEISAEIELDKAREDSARQARTRLLRGHRDEERSAAEKETEAAKAILTQAQDHLDHFQPLFEKGEISRDEFQQIKRDLDVAQANYDRAVEEQKLVNAQPLPEEISQADAEVAAAERTTMVTSARLEKCKVRAPISGTILKVMTKVGESYSSTVPHPILTLADESVRHVRAEVDERDISKVKLGQLSTVTADGFPGQSFKGRVIEITRAMKSKTVLSEDPTQKVDRDVLDVIIELDHPQQELPIGLRVTALMTDATAPPATPEISSLPASSTVGRSPQGNRVAATEGTVNPSKIVLQVAAMARKENADALIASLREKSFPAFVSKRDSDSLYRVDVGPYPDAENARVAAKELTSAGFGAAIERPYHGSVR